jgi:hypothetical protein
METQIIMKTVTCPQTGTGEYHLLLHLYTATDPDTGEPVWKAGDLITITQVHLRTTLTKPMNYGITIKITGINNNNIIGEIQAISSNILKPEDGAGQYYSNNLGSCIVLEENKPMFEYVFPRFAYRWKYIDNEYSAFSPFLRSCVYRK